MNTRKAQAVHASLLVMTALTTSVVMALTTGVVMAQPGGSASYLADLKPTHANLAYANASKSQVLDLFVPDGTGPFPVMINVHGGGFRAGSKEMLDAPIARQLLKEGIAVATINYRLSSEARFPAAIQDAKAAVRFLRANATRYTLDPNRFLAFGQSAGGNIASMLGTSGGVAEFDDPNLGNASVSSRVQGVIDWFGPTDFSQMDAQAKAQGCGTNDQTHGQANSPESAYLGAVLATVPELVKKANPITYIDPSDPPFLLQKGDKDCTVPFGQSQLLYDALKAAGVQATFETMKRAGHGDMGASTPIFLSDANIQRVLAFVKTTLK
jgi:acetyl esterase/lipase